MSSSFARRKHDFARGWELATSRVGATGVGAGHDVDGIFDCA